MNFLEKLDLLMAEKGISKTELSKGSGVPYTTILSFYDKGYDNVKLSTLKRLALYFDCSMDYLASDNNDDRNQKPFNYNDLSLSDRKMVEAYARASASDKKMVKTIVDKLLGQDGQDSE